MTERFRFFLALVFLSALLILTCYQAVEVGL